MPEPYSKLPHSPSGLVSIPTSDCSTTSVEFFVFSVHFVRLIFCSLESEVQIYCQKI